MGSWKDPEKPKARPESLLHRWDILHVILGETEQCCASISLQKEHIALFERGIHRLNEHKSGWKQIKWECTNSLGWPRILKNNSERGKNVSKEKCALNEWKAGGMYRLQPGQPSESKPHFPRGRGVMAPQTQADYRFGDFIVPRAPLSSLSPSLFLSPGYENLQIRHCAKIS